MLLKTTYLTLSRANAAPIVFPDLDIAAGACILLRGPSGSGKTTLLSMLAGLLQPSSGQILWQGADIYALSEAARDRVRGENYGFIFQTLHLLPAISVARNIALAMEASGRKPSREHILGLLTRLGIAQKYDVKPDRLSQGEQQRAAVARAVVHTPKIILADEPTSALDDEKAQDVIMLLLEQARQTGAALIVATHDSRIAHHFIQTIELGGVQKEVAA